jgi:fatty acid-binding protein DegV
MQADAEAEAQSMATDFTTALGVPEVPIYEMPPAIVVHAGPGVLGAGFFAAQVS